MNSFILVIFHLLDKLIFHATLSELVWLKYLLHKMQFFYVVVDVSLKLSSIYYTCVKYDKV